jgi:hypothetical protein
MPDNQKKFDALADDLATQPNVVRAKMFGMPSVTINGNAFLGFYAGSLICKLAGTDLAAALKLKGAHLFDPMGGRPMKEWAQIPFAHSAKWKKFALAAQKYVSGLPAK